MTDAVRVLALAAVLALAGCGGYAGVAAEDPVGGEAGYGDAVPMPEYSPRQCPRVEMCPCPAGECLPLGFGSCMVYRECGGGSE